MNRSTCHRNLIVLRHTIDKCSDVYGPLHVILDRSSGYLENLLLTLASAMSEQHFQPYDNAGNKYGELTPAHPGREDSPSTIAQGEYHPAADSAMAWYRNWRDEQPFRVIQTLEAFASTALSGNRLAEICHETLRRLIHGEPVSDRYLLGLVWTLQEMEGER